MSRIGNKPIIIPEGVTVEIKGNVINVKHKNLERSLEFPEVLTIEQKGNELLIKRPNDERQNRSLHGTFRAQIANLINGLHTPFQKVLEIIGVGYRANVEGNNLVLQLGFSHNVNMEIPKGLTVTVDKNTTVTISGVDKFTVGEFAANIRKLRKPEPYKGKGIRYQGEHVRRKAGKTAK